MEISCLPVMMEELTQWPQNSTMRSSSSVKSSPFTSGASGKAWPGAAPAQDKWEQTSGAGGRHATGYPLSTETLSEFPSKNKSYTTEIHYNCQKQTYILLLTFPLAFTRLRFGVCQFYFLATQTSLFTIWTRKGREDGAGELESYGIYSCFKKSKYSRVCGTCSANVY